MTPEGWRETPVLGAVEKADRLGAVPRSEYRAQGRFPVVDQGKELVAGFTDQEACVLNKSLPLIVFGDHTREWKFIDFPFAPGADGTQILQVRPEFDPRFLFFAFSRLPLKNLGYSRHFKLLRELAILHPVALPEQRKIAAILSSVDDAIECTQAVIDQLQVVKKAMMADLLTRGIPGRHKKFKQTEIGEVPETWEVVRLGDVGDWLSGGTPSKQESSLWMGPIPWVSPKDMKRPRICDAIDHVSKDALSRGTQLAPVGSILMVVRGMILAHTFPVAVTVGPVAFNQDIKALVPASRFESDFILYWLQERGSEILNLTDVSNHGTKRLPSELLFDSKVPAPSKEEQIEIVEILRSFDGRRESEQAWMAQLREVKSALMSVLLTGEVRVRVDEESAA